MPAVASGSPSPLPPEARLHYEGRIIRPPSEADSILLQVTVGCPHNRCSFCGAYRQVRYRIKERETVDRDLVEAARSGRENRRLFLCDGDALAIPQAELIDLLDRIRRSLPWITRIAAYASARSLHRRSANELRALREHGLALIHLGLESGDDQVLRALDKGCDVAGMVTAVRDLKAAGLRCAVSVILGLAGRTGGRRHSELTGAALSAMDPDLVGVLTLMLVPGTPLHDAARQGVFQLPDPAGMLRELRHLLAATTLSRGLFLANHASNFLPLALRLPRQKEEALRLIDRALAGGIGLRPDAWRGL